MRLRSGTMWVAGLVGLAVGAVASATTMLEQDVAALTKASAVVVRAKVLASRARWTADRARIVTDTEVEILDAWKGAPAARVVVMQPGGIVGEVGQKVAGAARFSVGEEVVLFLEPRGDRYAVSGMSQGAFHVERSSDGKTAFARQDLDEALLLDPVTRQPVAGPREILTVDQLKARVLAAVSTSPTTPVRPPASTRPPLLTP
ncbi:MAG: hypothetical protein AB1730_28820 [Myxococcota bacterium]|jgi:hypothetical protein